MRASPTGAAEDVGARGGRGLSVGYYLAYPDSMAGATRSLLELITNLPRAVRPTVFLPAGGAVAEACREHGVDYRIVAAPAALMRFNKAALAWSSLRKLWVLTSDVIPYSLKLAQSLREVGIDLLHVNCPRAALLAAPAARLLRAPVVGHLRGRQSYGGRAFELLCDRIVTVCDAVQADLSPQGRAKAVTVYNGVRAGSPANGRATQPERLRYLAALRERGEPIVSCFASLTPFKGQHHLLESVARLKQQGLRSGVFLCIGKTPEADRDYEAWLHARVAELGLDNVLFAGWQDQPFDFYAHSDVTVLASVERELLALGTRRVAVRGTEGFPRTHIEAMSMGLPIVGTDVAGVREQIVDGVTGLVVPPAAPATLADALAQLITDPALRRRMGAAGKQRVEALFSTERCVTRTLAVYESLVAPPGKRLPGGG
jgi:glycosyltransferase involved in cell wall biosynthesis